MKKRQVVVIHGGDSFNTYKAYLSALKKIQLDFARFGSGKKGWKRSLGAALGKRFEVILPSMPNAMNAHYAEWKMWFEKFVPHLRPGVVLVGHSLGGTFLAKYFTENTFPKKISGIFFVAPAFTAGDFTPKKDLKQIEKQADKLFLYYSNDDRVVPARDFARYRRALSRATVRVFKARGHFNQERFPELTRAIKVL